MDAEIVSKMLVFNFIMNNKAEISGSHGGEYVSMKMTVFWDVVSCSLVEVY
jgi:hypothetical protein